MGIADRDYYRNQPQQGVRHGTHLTPVVKGLLIANVGIFLLDYVILPVFFGVRPVNDNTLLVNLGAFSIQSAVLEFHVWKFITFQFLHGHLAHVLLNCIGFYFFGPWMERWWGSTKFLVFYLMCGVGGAAFFTFLTLVGLLPGDLTARLVGASAGLYGIRIGVAFVAPELRVQLLFPPIELSMRQLAIVMMVISVGSVLLNIGGNEGGEAGHLGGAILGFLLMRNPRLLGRGSEARITRPRAPTRPSEPKLRPRTELRLNEDSAVDLILDKVSREGVQSLTQAERDILRKASERQNSDP